MSFTVFQTSCLRHCSPVVPLLLVMIVFLCCRCCINKIELNWTGEQPNQWDSIRLMKVILSFPTVVNHFWIEDCTLLKLHFSNQTISTWFAVFSLRRCRVFSLLCGPWSLLLSLPANKREPPKWVQRLLQNPRAEAVPAAAACLNSAAFISTELPSCLIRSNTELSNVNVTLETKVHEIRTGQPPSRCYDYSSLQRVPAYLGEFTGLTWQPKWIPLFTQKHEAGWSQGPYAGPLPCPCPRRPLSHRCMRIRACFVAGRCRSRLSRLFL